MADKGTLVIADITGYTAFLSGSELEHAQDSLSSLLNLLLRETRHPLKVANLEGDAIFTYAVEGSFLQGQTLIEAIEQTYVVFRRALQQMVLNTTCACNACRNIPNLDLKFFVHHGEFITHKFDRRIDLVGTDVTLLHRLTKNTITESTGFVAYAAYTQAAVDALAATDICANMVRHSETYEHLGEVSMYVQDMNDIWERERDRTHITVEPSEAAASFERTSDLTPALAWDYATKPEYRAIITASEIVKIGGQKDGRIGADTTYFCAHGETTYRHTIVDWQPIDEYTFSAARLLGTTGLTTVRFEPVDGGRRTKVTSYLGRSRGPFLGRIVTALFTRFILPGILNKGLDALDEAVKRDMAGGAAVDRNAESPPVEISPEEVKEAVSASLSG